MKNSVREKRKECGITLRELARQVEVSPAFLSFVERGLRTPRLEVAFRIANALNCSIDEIFQEGGKEQ